MNKKSFVFIAIVLLLINVLPGFADSASQANRRTALRCLSNAKDYASEKQWKAAASQAVLGLQYDDSISDLWYVEAIAENELENTKAVVLSLVTNALTKSEWVDYNRDSARILYADILCDIGRYSEVPGILDAKPVLFSADAEYIRAKAYYRMKDEASIQTARNKIDTARKIYPDDTRFPLLFFKSESPSEKDTLVRKIADSFISRISLYAEAAPDKDAELEIYASLFAQGEQQTRMLKSFSARGLQHPLFAAAALRAGLLDEEAAFDYFISFADGSISYDILEDFIPLIKSSAVKQLEDTYFTAYSGVIISDTDGDGIENMFCKYSRGRPATIVYDKNQDGIVDWTITCDFGVPVNAAITDNALTIQWDPYPSLSQVVFKGKNDTSALTFNLVREQLPWTPIDIEPDKAVVENTGASFFYPTLRSDAGEITDSMLIKAASNYIIPSQERTDAIITFTILDSEAQLARYTVNGKLYAQAEFDNGVPTMRSVDADGDGVFETTEFYGYDKDNKMDVHTMEEERAVMTNLFGLPAEGSGFYLKLIQIDRDGDTIPDFTEEYLAHHGKISSWDTDGDGLWDIRYVRYPDTEGGLVVEDALFYEISKHDLVTVTSIDGVPSKVKTESTDGKGVNKTIEELPVAKDAIYNFYWIGKVGRSDFAKKALIALNQSESQGVSTTVSDGNDHMICVRIDDICYGQLIEPQEFEIEEQKKQEELRKNVSK
jgi:hypothetical protein